MSGPRIGIYGGSFSPPHLGHRRALSAFLRQEKPDEMLLIPALVPPHKYLEGHAAPSARLEMCRLAFGDLPVTVSDREIRRGGTSYTVLTLKELKTPDNTLILLCGTDMFLSLDTWYCADEIFRLAEIVYVVREQGATALRMRGLMEEKAEEYRSRYGATVRELSCAPIEVSSTELRHMLARREDTSAYLSEKVREYIEQCSLYL